MLNAWPRWAFWDALLEAVLQQTSRQYNAAMLGDCNLISQKREGRENCSTILGLTMLASWV